MMRHIEPNLNPPDCDDGVTELQEEIGIWLEANTLLPSIINDQIMELVAFYEGHCDSGPTDPAYRAALAERLADMSVRVSKDLQPMTTK